MECSIPTINSNKQEIKKIFDNTKIIAMMGLSPQEEKDSNKVARYLKSQGFRVIPVYPKGEEILGEKVYKNLADIPLKVDMVNIFRKPKYFAPIVKEAIKRGDVNCVWGQIGVVDNDAALIGKEAGIKIVQNYCTMVEHKAIIT
jgi:predicted CoA-binding protein